MKSNIIAISGLRNSGKSTAAAMLYYLLNTPKILHNYKLYKIFGSIFKKGKWKLTSFAYPLKKTLAALLNISVDKFEDRDFKENWYINFESMTITSDPPIVLKISDSKFNKALRDCNYSYLQAGFITIRQLLQWFGTSTMRGTFGDKLWILLTLTGNNILISDLRFKVEEEEVHKQNGYIIYIKNDNCEPGNHASEREVITLEEEGKFDCIINNNGTLEDLFNNLKLKINEF